MSDKKNFLANQNSGFFQDIVLRLKLILRLMGDKRVNLLLKLLPVGALVYLVSPVDLIPGVALPVIGALDDAAVLWLGATLFVALCPDDVVQEHTNALQKVVPGTWRDAPEADEESSGEIVDSVAHEAPGGGDAPTGNEQEQ
jgi:uncharacterized membrane protein YkvA (DUF1232 family)